MRSTIEVTKRRELLIYSAQMSTDELLGDPDLLRLDANGHVAADLKSGSGGSGDEDDVRLKKHSGVQLALRTDILEHPGFASTRRRFTWNVRGEEDVYDLKAPQAAGSPGTMWSTTQDAPARARHMTNRTGATTPA